MKGNATYFEFVISECQNFDTTEQVKYFIQTWKQFLKSEFVSQYKPEMLRNYELVNVDLEHRLPGKPLKLWFFAPLNIQRLFIKHLENLGVELYEEEIFGQAIIRYIINSMPEVDRVQRLVRHN